MIEMLPIAYYRTTFYLRSKVAYFESWMRPHKEVRIVIITRQQKTNKEKTSRVTLVFRTQVVNSFILSYLERI